ncbi:MAG: hypothetical protein K6T81_11110 [Alicyclobacillus macrosporangiidus]|uniref:hypothetical protein n=1 Tax=Alicyclobacillus macrosporangiidus TaxID=392015 RepID=UPI0026EE16A0|nr:hypothetical protein [Alicyclobacillus macrosporangiidus]MCL6599273.1 hypothetical protein [Alicyclobacillus macrosporangiidus]
MDEQTLRAVLVDVLSEVLPIHLKPIENRLDKLEKRLGEVEQRLDLMEQGLDKVEQRLDQMEQRLDKVEQRLDEVERRLNHVKHRLDNVERELEAVKLRFTQVESQLTRVETSLASTQSMVTQLIDDVGRVNEVMHRTNRRIDVMDGQHLRHERRLNRHRNQIGQLAEEMALIRQKAAGAVVEPLHGLEDVIDTSY